MSKSLKYVSEFEHDPKFGFTGSAGKTAVGPYLRKSIGGKVGNKQGLQAKVSGYAKGGEVKQNAGALFNSGGEETDYEATQDKFMADKVAATKKRGGPIKKAKGGSVVSEDVKEDKKIVKKAITQHDDQLHGGKKTVLKLNHGGMGSYKKGGGVPSFSGKPLVGKR